MSNLRIGTNCAVINDEGHVLLSKRGDFDVWNLPGGRLDAGELIERGAVREVLEETGIHCELTRVIGLYYQKGRNRLDVVYAARPVGGELVQSTFETRANRYFNPDDIPDNTFGDYKVRDAFKKTVNLHILTTPASTLRMLQLKLAWRWMTNLLRGKPEPRWPAFEVYASLETRGQRYTVRCDGRIAPWEQIARHARMVDALCLDGIGQSVDGHMIEFLFKRQTQARACDHVNKFTILPGGRSRL